MPPKIAPPKAVLKVLMSLRESGFEAYAVGGCVRDSLLSITPGDWDIATGALPEQVADVFEGHTVVPTGIKHGTVTVVFDSEPIEITTFRVDGPYSDGRRPDSVSFEATLRDDLSRRDFTINALAWSPGEGVIDHFGGLSDLADGVIRCVGEPEARFAEDALRILRCVRFASTLGFIIEAGTVRAMREMKGNLALVAHERVRAELEKALLGRRFEAVFTEHRDILIQCIPEMAPAVDHPQIHPYHIYDVYRHIIKSVANAPRDVTVRMTMLLHDIGKPSCHTRDNDGIDHFRGHDKASYEMAKTSLNRLRFPARMSDDILTLIKYHDDRFVPEPSRIKRRLSRIGPRRFEMLIHVKRADAMAQSPSTNVTTLKIIEGIEECFREILEKNECYAINMLAVDGDDLIEMGINPGKAVGDMLHLLLERVIDDDIPNERSDLLRLVFET
jgi:tRNA nucleotidyltransferase (CCA-adding enzyme)